MLETLRHVWLASGCARRGRRTPSAGGMRCSFWPWRPRSLPDRTIWPRARACRRTPRSASRGRARQSARRARLEPRGRRTTADVLAGLQAAAGTAALLGDAQRRRAKAATASRLLAAPGSAPRTMARAPGGATPPVAWRYELGDLRAPRAPCWRKAWRSSRSCMISVASPRRSRTWRTPAGPTPTIPRQRALLRGKPGDRADSGRPLGHRPVAASSWRTRRAATSSGQRALAARGPGAVSGAPRHRRHRVLHATSW